MPGSAAGAAEGKLPHKTKKDSYQKLSLLWCRNAIQIRTISLGCNFCRFSKGDGLCSFFIVEGYQNLIIIQVNRIDEGIHQCLPLVFRAHVQLTEPQQPSQSNFFNRLQHRWIEYRKYTVFVLDYFLDLRLCLTTVMPFFSA